MPPNTKTIGMLGKKLNNLVIRHGITNTRSESYLKHAAYANGNEITDYAFVSRGINVTNLKFERSEASDHLPRVLECDLTRA